MDKIEIMEAINRLFVAVDKRNWKEVKDGFSDEVLLDYTSMTGGKPALLKPDQIIDSWKSILPGFDKTHHQVSNYIIALKGNSASLICYGTATHYLRNESNNNIWTVVGSYDFEVVKVAGVSKVTGMKFNLSYIDGNAALPEMAQKKIAGSV